MDTDNNFERVLVCITDQYSCERLIKKGREIADEMGLPLQVINVQSTNSAREINGEVLEYLYKKAVSSNAEMVIYYNDEPALITAGHIRKYNVRHVVTGMPSNMQSSGFIRFLQAVLPDIAITVVPESRTSEQYIAMLPVCGLAAKAAGEQF